jgi:hypothetical protein
MSDKLDQTMLISWISIFLVLIFCNSMDSGPTLQLHRTDTNFPVPTFQPLVKDFPFK